MSRHRPKPPTPEQVEGWRRDAKTHNQKRISPRQLDILLAMYNRRRSHPPQRRKRSKRRFKQRQLLMAARRRQLAHDREDMKRQRELQAQQELLRL